MNLIIALALALGAPACNYEDGSGQGACVWNAKAQGNGKGHSLLIINGGKDHAKVIRISHRTANRITR